MTFAPKDPLLVIAKVVVWFLLVVMAIGCGATLLAIPAVLLDIGGITADLAAQGAPPETRWLIVLVLLGAFALLAMLVQFFRYLLRIIDTVRDGDPFVPDNAKRLTIMAWLMLAVQVVALPLTGLGVYITKTVGENPGTIDADFDASGFVLVLTLFILARVFRHGTAMRDDLEGTV